MAVPLLAGRIERVADAFCEVGMSACLCMFQIDSTEVFGVLALMQMPPFDYEAHSLRVPLDEAEWLPKSFQVYG